MKIGEPTLDERYREAQADLAKGGPEVALKWAFRHAKAVARVTRAEAATKVHDSERLGLRLELHDRQEPEARLDAFEALERTIASLTADAVDLADARAAEAFCAHVWQLAARTPRQQQQPAARPIQKPRAA